MTAFRHFTKQIEIITYLKRLNDEGADILIKVMIFLSLV